MESESKFQSRCFVAHWNHYPQLRGRLCCVNNNSQNAIKGSFNKAIGIVAGVSDMFYLLENGKIIWLEFKLIGGRQSDKQKQWQNVCESLGHTYKIIYSDEDFWNTINLPNPVV